MKALVIILCSLFISSTFAKVHFPYMARSGASTGGGGVDVGNGRIVIDNVDYRDRFYTEYELISSLKRDEHGLYKSNDRVKDMIKMYECDHEAKLLEFDIRRIAPYRQGLIYRIEFSGKLKLELNNCKRQ